MSDDCELLFFDTFSHDSCEELNLDLVQFPHPVFIFEIRVIPLGARVQADFPGGHRLGATNPSAFRLEFFANDLTKRNASTFEQLGSLDYKQNVEIQFTVSSKIPTDGLVLRGLYSAVTLAVYGVLTKPSSKERAVPAPPPPPQTTASQSQDHHQIERSVSDSSGNDWDRHQRPIESVSDSSASAAHPHSQPLVDGPRYSEVPPIIHPKTEPHVQYSAEIPQPVYPDPPPPNIVYPECIPASVPQPVSYSAYDSRYQKQWSSSEEHYHNQNESFDPQVYSRPPDAVSYLPPASVPHPSWEPKDSHATADMTRQDHDSYEQGSRDQKLHSRNKDRRDKPWDRDSNPSDYNKDDDLSRDRDYKRKEHWDRSSSESDRYRDRERNKESSSRERDRSRDVGRDKPRAHDGYSDRGSRPSAKRPVTPPTPPPSGHPRMPQTPPEPDKPSGGPRTPKEDSPSESFEDKEQGSAPRTSEFLSGISTERSRTGEFMYNLSEGEVQEGDNTDDDGYEEIVSEEEIMSDGEDRVLDMAEMEYDLGDESWNYMSSFSPYTCELIPCQHFEDPTLTPMESLQRKKGVSKDSNDMSPKANELLDLICQFEGKELTEKWVEAMESLTSQMVAESIVALDSEQSHDEVVDTLVKWVLDGLNFEFALSQPQTAYKVRHIKAGIHVAALLFRTSDKILEKLLDCEVPKLLLGLMDQPYMSLPIKLMIVRALDALTCSKQGVHFLLEKNLEFAPPKKFDVAVVGNGVGTSSLCQRDAAVNMTCYQKLLDTLMSKQLTRAIVAVSALLEKIHLFEVLQELQEAVESIPQNVPPEPPKNIAPAEAVAEDTASDTAEVPAPPVDMEIDPLETNSAPLEETAHIIVASLNKISSIYHNAWKKVAQSKRFLPARTQFEFPKSPYDPYPGLLRIFKECHLLENLLFLLSSASSVITFPVVITAMRDLLTELLHTQNGMLFLLSSPDTTNGILKILLQNLDENRDDGSDENIALNLGLQIAYHLQTVLYMDVLFCHHSKMKELDDSEAVSALHHMYTMIFSPIGRAAVVEVLTTDNNLNCLLPFIQMTDDDDKNRRACKSVCAGYVTELLMLIMHSSENVAMLEKFGEVLYNISQQELTPKLQDLGLWVSPVKSLPAYNHEAVPALAAVIKCHLEDAATLPPELITAVRVLKHICLPQDQDNQELKYMYATVQFFANDGLSYLVTILQNICDVYLKPSHQSISLVGQQGVLVMGVVKPSVSLVKGILGYLISCRKEEFKDLVAIPVLLKTYSLMLIVPPSSFAFTMIHIVQEEIIEALLAYTQPCLGPDESDEALNKSLWTQMVQEVLKFIQESPRTFIAGLSVLSELLPLPLPLQTRVPLKPEEINRTINQRKLWSAHLHSVSAKLQEVIRSLAASSSHPLQQLLRRICIQLADLAAPSALVVVRAVLDALLETLDAETKDTMDNPILSVTTVGAPSPTPASSRSSSTATPAPPSTAAKPCSLSTARVLNLISYLVSHASFKIPMMHILKASTKADEKYADLLNTLLNLMNIASDKPSHIQAQECIVSVLQALCDPVIGFVAFDSETNVNEVLASCLPSKEQMLQICVALIQHIGSHSHQYASILPSLRSLVMLNEHDYGFYNVKLALEQNPDKLLSLFCRLSKTFSKDSSDYLSTLSTTLDFLRLMVNGYEEGPQAVRTMLLSPSELASLLRKKPEKDDVKKSEFQPLVELEKMLSEATTEEDTLESLLEGISSLLLLLHEANEKEKPEVKEMVEPALPPPEILTNQFTSRPVFVVGEVEEERLSPAYWLSVPVAEEVDQEQEQVTVDLMTLSEKCISPEFDLKSQLEALCTSSDAAADVKKDKSLSFGGKRKYQTLINPTIAETGIKKPFIAPMRGRGFARATTHSTRANDPFRSRPPNTSRPPSMHVDDFLALESNHPSGNAQAQLKRQDGSRGRGRGFDRGQAFPSVRGGGGNSGGRFFSPPGPYGRRDPNSRGGSRGTLRISTTAWGNRATSTVLKSPASIGVRTSFSPRPSLSDRCNYGDPFVPPEIRLTTQRGRDPYTDVELPPDGMSLRFSRGVRTTSTLVPTVQSHWPESRNKAQNQRFMSSLTPARGSGRRELNGRHARSFTR